MKKILINSIKIVLPLLLGVFLIWYYAQSLDEQGWLDIREAFGKADYSWIFFSVVFFFLSHMSRAYRWKYTLRPLGYEPKFLNSFFSVMIAYLVNLAIPRLGEVTRCGVMSRYEQIPFEKLLGTVIAERLADFIILITIAVVVAFIQLEVIESMLVEMSQVLSDKFSPALVIALVLIAILGGAGVLVLLFNKKIQHPTILKIRVFVQGLLSGIQSILTMKDKWAFIGHTVFIWVMYLVMFYVCIFSLPETSNIPFGGVFTAFVLGGFAIALTNGGIGAYPLAIVQVLSLYGVSEGIAGAFGWIVWTAQTVLLLIIGALSFALMPIYNSKNKETQGELAKN